MKIAYTLAPGRGETNLLLAELARVLTGQGLRLCGTVQVDIDRETDDRCDMDVMVLPDGPTIRISQSLGKNARGCRLDPEALEQAVALSDQALDGHIDLLIVNKFGKHEAEGRGFRDTIGKALANGVPVLVGANKLNVDALNTFCDGAAQQLAPDLASLVNWIQTPDIATAE
nr:DUF2478 domain-containing protein [uncultured Shimia sp.]